MTTPIPGFWLPQNIRDVVLKTDPHWETLTLAAGRPAIPNDHGAVTAQWPVLDASQWNSLFDALEQNRKRVPKGPELWSRLKPALNQSAKALADPANPRRSAALHALSSYTGFSDAMIEFTLGSMDLFALDTLQAAMNLDVPRAAAQDWVAMDRLPGRIRFYHGGAWLQALTRIPTAGQGQLFSKAQPPRVMLGYGAGNVPGTALMIAFLGQAIAAAGHEAPIVIAKNSRREPIFSPLVLDTIEQIDPDIVANIAVLIWDYEDEAIQRPLLDRADLVIAASGDETIQSLQRQINQSHNPARFHAHGHKVSFTTIAKSFLAKNTPKPNLDIITLLAALDSVFWDQFGCLSSRIHFVERGGNEHYTPEDYAQRLTQQLRLLAVHLPRGAWPGHWIHDRFDKYIGLEAGGEVKVFSSYDDPFVVAVDNRPPTSYAFQNAVNDCQTRTILVRPINRLLDVPEKFLSLIPHANLQSMSVAAGEPDQGMGNTLIPFAEACCQRGVTALRTVGRGAFPQLAYSWDGYIPLDLLRTRPAGRFATIEFDKSYDEVIETYELLLKRGAEWRTTEVGLSSPPIASNDQAHAIS